MYSYNIKETRLIKISQEFELEVHTTELCNCSGPICPTTWKPSSLYQLVQLSPCTQNRLLRNSVHARLIFGCQLLITAYNSLIFFSLLFMTSMWTCNLRAKFLSQIVLQFPYQFFDSSCISHLLLWFQFSQATKCCLHVFSFFNFSQGSPPPAPIMVCPILSPPPLLKESGYRPRRCMHP